MADAATAMHLYVGGFNVPLDTLYVISETILRRKAKIRFFCVVSVR